MKSRLFSKRTIAFFTALIMTVAFVLPVLAACGKKSEDGYTYNEYISRFPSSWSTHGATSDADLYVQQYTEMGLYAYTLSEDRSTYAFVDEMATGDPKNVTESYKGRYGIDESEETNTGTGKAWEITLNPDATWENGEKITAEDYVWSMERVLSPDMKNNLALTYTTGETAIYNAKSYYNGGYQENYYKISANKTYTEEELLALVADGTLYFSFQTHIIDDPTSHTLESHHNIASMQKYYLNEDDIDVYDLLYSAYSSEANEYGYIQITEENFEVFKTNLTVLSESVLKAFFPNWYVLLSVKVIGVPEYTKIAQNAEYEEQALLDLINDGKVYFSFQTHVTDDPTSHTLESHHNIESMQKYYLNEDEEDVYTILYEKYASQANEYGYIQITTRNYEDFKTNLTVLSESALKAFFPNWYVLFSIVSFDEENAPTIPFTDVGIFQTGDMKFVIVFENALSLWQVKNLLTSNWIVYKSYYEEGYTQQGSLTFTTYGTTSGKYMGYGPYKLSTYEIDKQIVLVRNEGWYGYNPEACNYHEGEYMTDKIVCQVISDQATALLEFESGNLDSVVLSANDSDKYKFSDYLLKRTASNTWSITFNSDAEKLAALESDGNGNRRILSVYEFRKALSLCLDRNYIGQNILVGSDAAFSFINSNYYYDLENNPDSIYRDSQQAKQAIVNLYGIEYGEDKTYKTLDEAYRAITGYDIDAAKENFETAAQKAIEAGLYTSGQNIRITIYNSSTSAKFTALITYIQQQVTAATAGTALEGKVTVTSAIQQSGLADSLNNGQIEARYYSYAGDYSNPNGMIANFTDKGTTTLQECGFDPATETFSITCDFNGDGTATTETRTYYEWQKSIAAGGVYATASESVRLEILSQLEYNLLNGFRTLPLCVGTDLTLRSKKVNYATDNANIFVAYGGVRLMTYNYTDAEWAKFCKNSSNLNYT